MFFYIFTCFFIFFFRRLAAIKHFLLYRTDVKSSKFVDKIILIMVICFSKTITRGSWGTIRTGLSPRKQKNRLIRAIGYAELKVRGQKNSV